MFRHLYSILRYWILEIYLNSKILGKPVIDKKCIILYCYCMNNSFEIWISSSKQRSTNQENGWKPQMMDQSPSCVPLPLGFDTTVQLWWTTTRKVCCNFLRWGDFKTINLSSFWSNNLVTVYSPTQWNKSGRKSILAQAVGRSDLLWKSPSPAMGSGKNKIPQKPVKPGRNKLLWLRDTKFSRLVAKLMNFRRKSHENTC